VLVGGRHLVVPTFTNEFWTARQRAAQRLHEVSYRACFKPQLPRFFIEHLTGPGDLVLDPFMGRGTTPLEAALCRRVPAGCDVNPLSVVLTRPRLEPPTVGDVVTRLAAIPGLGGSDPAPDVGCGATSAVPEEDLLVFFHPETLARLCVLRAYLLAREAVGALDGVDRWIRMVAVNRLTGHSPGFFSVYTLPPNQAVSATSQRRINARLGQAPAPRDVARLIVTKTRSLLSQVDDAVRRALERAARWAVLMTGPSAALPALEDGAVALCVTSPPFLDVVDYATDNWLRCWFCGVDPAGIELTVLSNLEAWQAAMTRVLCEVARVLRPGGHVAFEVGEVRGGRVRLEETVVPCGVAAGLEPVLVLINTQAFTKTANCWGVTNGKKGTNSNRVVIFTKPG
jgi:hypothetical protein